MIINFIFLTFGFFTGFSFGIIDQIGYASYILICELKTENENLKTRVEDLETQLELSKTGE